MLHAPYLRIIYPRIPKWQHCRLSNQFYLTLTVEGVVKVMNFNNTYVVLLGTWLNYQFFQLKTLSNLLDDPICAAEVTKNSQFSWPSLLALMQSKFLAIQHAALKTVDQLICRYKDQVVQKTFMLSTGVLDLCDILEVSTQEKVNILQFPSCFFLWHHNRNDIIITSGPKRDCYARGLGFDSQVEQKVLLGFSMKFSVAARS